MATKVVKSEYNLVQLNELIKKRRSYFPAEYTGEEVPKAVIEQMLENANWAPTHGKTEPWRFFVFEGEAKKTFADFQADLYKELTPEADFDEKKFTKLSTMPLKASHVIAICMKRQQSEKIPEIEEVEAVACAVQNMYLTVSAYGYGGYWASGGVTYKEEAKEFFGLGDKDKLLGFFYVGVPAIDEKEGFRNPYQEKVTWISE
ncbi:nitroreductase [Limibacter armeniacum]|uniref:nitroreductase family protein n=1 Tax=Limibacter armeniacum TaxID=466084 RepID=UPI002FE5B3ED